MKSKSIIVIFISLGFLAASLLAQGVPLNPANPTPFEPERNVNYDGSLFPLKAGVVWQYKIYNSGAPVGTLRVEVKSREQIDKTREWGPALVEVTYKDTYKRVNTTKTLLQSWSTVFIKNKNDGKFYPFTRNHWRLGERFGRLLVTDIVQKKSKFSKWEPALVTLRHLDKDYVERYLEGVGLYYYKNGTLEYKLEDFKEPSQGG